MKRKELSNRLSTDPVYAAAFLARYGWMLCDELNVKSIQIDGSDFALVFPANGKPEPVPAKKIDAWMALFPEDKKLISDVTPESSASE